MPLLMGWCAGLDHTHRWRHSPVQISEVDFPATFSYKCDYYSTWKTCVHRYGHAITCVWRIENNFGIYSLFAMHDFQRWNPGHEACMKSVLGCEPLSQHLSWFLDYIIYISVVFLFLCQNILNYCFSNGNSGEARYFIKYGDRKHKIWIK